MAPSKRRILVVDDDVSLCRMVACLLERRGFSVDCSESGLNALDKLRNFAPHLVLVDIRMPEMSGLDLCREIRKDSAYRGIPLMILSALPANLYRGEFMESGAVDYVEKPFLIADLTKRVTLALGEAGH